MARKMLPCAAGLFLSPVFSLSCLLQRPSRLIMKGMSVEEFHRPKIFIAFRFILDFCFATDAADLKKATRKEGEKREFVARLRALLGAVNRLNQKGVMVKLTWSIGAMKSYDLLLRLAPELLEEIQTRVAVGYDEINDYSRNEALMPFMTDSELRTLHEMTADNPLVRLAEPFMPMAGGVYSPALLPVLNELGIKGISFNIAGLDASASDDLMEELSFHQQHNPIWLTRSHSKEKTMLLPSLSAADLRNEGGLKRILLKLNRQNEESSAPKDLLLLFDEYISSPLLFADNDDWESMDFCRLEEEIESVAMFSFIQWSTPASYVQTHEPNGLLIVDRDLIAGMDGSLNPWCAKWENRELWSLLQHSRLYCRQAVEEASGFGKKRLLHSTESAAAEIERRRVKLLDESYFGPNFITQRVRYVNMGLAAAKRLASDSSALLLSVLTEKRSAEERENGSGRRVSFSVNHRPGTSVFPVCGAPLTGTDFDSFSVGENFIENNAVRIEHHPKKGVQLVFKSIFNAKPLKGAFSVVRKGHRLTDFGKVEYISGSNDSAQLIVSGTLHLRPSVRVIHWKHLYWLKYGEAAVYVTLQVQFPNAETPVAKRGAPPKGVDGSWLDLSLDEIHPACFDLPELRWPVNGFKFWRDPIAGSDATSGASWPAVNKQRGELRRLLENKRERLFNSQLINRWFGVAFNSFGLAVAQKTEEGVSGSFCPLFFERHGGRLSVQLNLMGQYEDPADERDYKNFSIRKWYRSWGRKEASFASTYAGKTIEAGYRLTPFKGTELPASVIRDSERFASFAECSALTDREFEVTG